MLDAPPRPTRSRTARSVASARPRSVRQTSRPDTTPATTVLPARRPDVGPVDAAARAPGPAPIASTGVPASTGSASPRSPKYEATKQRGRSASASRAARRRRGRRRAPRRSGRRPAPARRAVPSRRPRRRARRAAARRRRARRRAGPAARIRPGCRAPPATAGGTSPARRSTGRVSSPARAPARTSPSGLSPSSRNAVSGADLRDDVVVVRVEPLRHAQRRDALGRRGPSRSRRRSRRPSAVPVGHRAEQHRRVEHLVVVRERVGRHAAEAKRRRAAARLARAARTDGVAGRRGWSGRPSTPPAPASARGAARSADIRARWRREMAMSRTAVTLTPGAEADRMGKSCPPAVLRLDPLMLLMDDPWRVTRVRTAILRCGSRTTAARHRLLRRRANHSSGLSFDLRSSHRMDRPPHGKSDSAAPRTGAQQPSSPMDHPPYGTASTATRRTRSRVDRSSLTPTVPRLIDRLAADTTKALKAIRRARARALAREHVYTTSPRTTSGARSSRWPATSWRGCRCSPWTAPPAAGNPNACGCACSPSPDAWSTAADGSAPHCRPMALGNADHHRRHPPASLAGAALTSIKPLHRPRKDTHGLVEPRPPGATAGPSP